jgi:hypothetical protein
MFSVTNFDIVYPNSHLKTQEQWYNILYNVNNTTHYLTHVSQDTPSYLLKLKTYVCQQIYVETT